MGTGTNPVPASSAEEWCLSLSSVTDPGAAFRLSGAMPRTARIVIPGLPYHVTHRGNRRGDVFVGPADFEAYLRLLARRGERCRLELWAYCLMPNHVHLLVRPNQADSLARTVREVHGFHALCMNRANGWSGHLWANRYFSAPLDQRHLWAAVRYVERNPVRAGLVAAAEEYPWSSARAHCGLAPRGALSVSSPFPGPIGDWREWLSAGGDEAEEKSMRRSTATGRPSGDDAFVAELELRLGRPLTPLPRDREREKR